MIALEPYLLDDLIDLPALGCNITVPGVDMQIGQLVAIGLFGLQLHCFWSLWSLNCIKTVLDGLYIGLPYLGLTSTFDLYLMRCHYLHFILVQFLLPAIINQWRRLFTIGRSIVSGGVGVILMELIGGLAFSGGNL